MPSLGIARTMEVASTYIPCRRMVRHRFQASFRRVRVFTERRLDFKQSSLCHITRVPSRTPSMPSQGRDFPGMLLSRPPFDFGLAIRPRNDPPSSSQLRWGYDRAPPRRTIYTRLTATGRHELRVACTCTATSARARAVNATRPSIPAAARPALRCVTCRTLTSVSDQFRSMSFCRFRAFARSPSRTALKILRRSRRTRSSCIRQSTCCQASPSNTPGGSSGPFTELSVSRCLSTTGIRFLGTLSRREFRPDHSRPTSTAHAYLRTRCGPRRGFTTFHTRETRTGPGALFTPRMTVFAGHRVVRSRRLPPPNGRSLPPRHCVPTRDVDVTRHQQEFPDSRPIPVLPLTCDRHGWDDGPWAFPWASHPTDQEPDTHATAGTRSNTDPELRLRHPSNLLHELTHNVRLRVATTGIVRIGRSGWRPQVHPPILASLAKLTKIGCTDMTCSVVSCTSTGELHERISAPHGRSGELLVRAMPDSLLSCDFPGGDQRVRHLTARYDPVRGPLGSAGDPAVHEQAAGRDQAGAARGQRA